MDNLAQEGNREDFGYEILNGKIVNMAPASTGHTSVVGAIYAHMFHHFRGKTCKPFVDGIMVHLSEIDKVVPDVMVICHPEIIKESGVYGSPDLVVEVLSPSTAFNDKGYKKSLYESNGVREYWIVDIKGKSIDVYRLTEKGYVLDQAITQPTPGELELYTEEERKNQRTAVQSCIFPDLFIPLEDIFEDYKPTK